MSEAAPTGDPLAIDEYAPGSGAVLSDAERWPTLTPDGAARLRHWREHPTAPRWTHATGDRLTVAQIARVRTALPAGDWLPAHLETVRATLHYRGMTGLHGLADFPTISREDLAADVAAFVPLDADLDRAVHGTSSGSTGAALVMPDDIEETARGFFLLLALAAEAGVPISAEAGGGDGQRLALANLVHQRQAYTYVSVLSAFGQRATARINLHPVAWPAPVARIRFLADADPEILTGDPTSLGALREPALRAALHPRVIFSGAMALSAPLRSDLEDAFGCPVFDVYGLHETRPIAVRRDDGPFRVLPRRVVVEVLDDTGVPVPDGGIGEITVTAGENPLLPLARYRTGDFGRLVPLPDGGLGIAELEGREHTRFRAADGSLVPCVDLTQQLQRHGARGWTVEQDGTGAIAALIADGDTAAVEAALRALLGQPVQVERVSSIAGLGEGKPRRYRSTAV